MTVKQVICEALRLVGRGEIAAEIEGNGVLSDEAKRQKRAFLTYLNSVLDELARGYFPIRTEEEMTSEDEVNGNYPFFRFMQYPSKIVRVTSGGKPVKWHISYDRLIADSNNITVTYEYPPAIMSENGMFAYPDLCVSPRMVEYGMAAEYFIVQGDATGYAIWENRYHDEIEAQLARHDRFGTIPPRRWI